MKHNNDYEGLDEFEKMELEDEQDESSVMSGYGIFDEDGNELDEKANKIDADDISQYVLDDSEETIASAIPDDEQTVLIDSPATAFMKIGERVDMKFVSSFAELFINGKKIGSLKEAFVKQMKFERYGLYATCSVKSIKPMAFLLIEYSSVKKDGAMLIDGGF